MLQNYREPNVYSKVTRRQPRVPETIVDLYPLVIGTGFEDYASEILIEEVELNAGATTFELSDVTPDDKVVSVVVKNGTVVIEGSTFKKESDSWKVTLLSAVSATETTYLTVEVGIEGKGKFELQRFTGRKEDIEDFYGPVYDDNNEKNKKINNISLGASIALESGSPVVYVLQVASAADNKTLAENYKKALDECAVDVAGNPFWRIQPVDAGEEIQDVVAKFVKEMSSSEERAEKYYGIDTKTTGATTAKEVEDAFKAAIEKYTSNPNNYDAYRMQTFYPNEAEYTFTTPNGDVDEFIGGEFIAIAIAGAEQALERASQSLTNSVIPAGIFKSLKGVSMRRKEKNAIAAYGVTLLTQETENGAITIRDSLSMDVSTEQVSDPCVTRGLDYGSKYVRGQLHPYIGKYNINEELIAKAQASATTAFATLVQKKIWKSANITDIFQNENDLNNLIIAARVGVLYPLKTIDVNIFCD